MRLCGWKDAILRVAYLLLKVTLPLCNPLWKSSIHSTLMEGNDKIKRHNRPSEVTRIKSIVFPIKLFFLISNKPAHFCVNFTECVSDFETGRKTATVGLRCPAVGSKLYYRSFAAAVWLLRRVSSNRRLSAVVLLQVDLAVDLVADLPVHFIADFPVVANKIFLKMQRFFPWLPWTTLRCLSDSWEFFFGRFPTSI